jgi:peptidoglycan glycosyltransferase
MNKQIRRLAIALLACYLVLFVQLNVLAVGRQQELNADPRNNRQTERDFNRPRGNIVAADGTVLARSVPTTRGDQFKYQREYPLGDLFGNVTGYYTFSFGSTQIEQTQNDVLMGDTTDQKLRAIGGLFRGTDNTGSVVLSMRPDVQQVAADALGTREGSVVVMDPHTGAVIAMISNPRYNPADVAVHNTKLAEDVLTFLNAYPGKPLLANAYQERYMPGSSFKVITTSIAFENGVTTLDRQVPASKSWVPPQTTDPIQNFGGTVCGGSMVEVFYRSCNIPFAQLATELGPERMVEGTKKWGIGEKVPIDLPAPAASSFGEVSDFTDQLPLLAIGGFGQGSTTMVPLHMAMIASTIANGGVMMKPHVIDATLDHDGGVLTRTTPSVWKTPIAAATAEIRPRV